MLDIGDFQINQNEAAEDAMVKDEIDPVMGVIEGDAVLPADEGEAFAKFEQKGLEVIAETGFEVGLGDVMRFGDFQKLEDVGTAQQVRRLRDNLAFGGELENGVFVFSSGEAEEERGFLLSFSSGMDQFSRMA